MTTDLCGRAAWQRDERTHKCMRSAGHRGQCACFCGRWFDPTSEPESIRPRYEVVDVHYDCGCETGLRVGSPLGAGAFVRPCALHRTEPDPVHAVRRKVEDLCRHEIGRLRQELLHTEGDLAVAVHEARAARDAVERVRALHLPCADIEDCPLDHGWSCHGCDHELPCPTLRALDGAE